MLVPPHVFFFAQYTIVGRFSFRESLSNVRQRTDQIDAFTTETSCLTIVWAVMQDIRFPKIPVG
ncbi:MAG: hypothetical protein NVS2B2_25780 [Ktedonobacteraceae bacterium]